MPQSTNQPAAQARANFERAIFQRFSMDVRVSGDEFAVLDWLYAKWARAAPDVQDFLAPVLRDQLDLDEGRYNKARDFLLHFEFVETREAELESGEKAEAIKLTPDGQNFYRHAVCEPGRFRFEPPPAADERPGGA